MATIAACPHCYTQLAMPESALETDVAQCPQCAGEFRLAEIRPLPLLEAKIVTPASDNAASSAVTVPSLEEFGFEQKTPETVQPAQEEVADLASKATLHVTHDETVQKESSLGASLKQAADLTEKTTNFPSTVPSFELPKWDLPTDDSESVGIAESEPVVANFSLPESAGESGLNFAALQPRRRGSKMRLATGIVGGGVLGSLLGLYGLLWLRGPSADYLNLAQYLPDSMLPPSARSAADETESEALPIETSVLASTTHRDDAVQPATAVEPVPSTPPPREIYTEKISSAEFAKLLATAAQAQPSLVAGNLADSEAVRTKGQAYMAMCRLAEKLDATGETDSTGDMQQATAMFRQTLSREQLAHELGQIASRWWEHADRPSQGVFFVGQVQSTQALDGQSFCQVAIQDGATTRTLPVLTQEGSYSPGQLIGIVGLIVANPQQQISGFRGSESQVVVATRAFPLDAP